MIVLPNFYDGILRMRLLAVRVRHFGLAGKDGPAPAPCTAPHAGDAALGRGLRQIAPDDLHPPYPRARLENDGT
jgi:hypothetical protein